MNAEKSFFKNNLAFVFSLSIMVLAFVGGWVSSFFEEEEAQRIETFLVDTLSTKPSLSSPSITANIIFKAIKLKNVKELDLCLLSEDEFNELKNSLDTTSPSDGLDLEQFGQLTSYQVYKDHLSTKFADLISGTVLSIPYQSISLDGFSQGSRISLSDYDIVDGMELFMTIKDSAYAETQIKITLPTIVKTSTPSYKFLQ